MKNTPICLIILDGWGYREESDANAIALANTPNWDQWWREYPHCLIDGSGEAVGLPTAQMGNSEVGHISLGSGRVIEQDYTRINTDIANGQFAQNIALKQAIAKTKQHQSALHVMGLLSPGGVHSHEAQIHAIIEMAAEQGVNQLFFHAFLDGRDTPPKSALASIEATENCLAKVGIGRIASLVGRYYAMDRDNRWDRIQAAYDMLTQGASLFTASTAEKGLKQAYARGETDEFVQPTLITPKGDTATIKDNDVVIFMNFRSDRARQLTRTMTEPSFNAFKRQTIPKLSEFVTLTEYADDIKATPAYPPVDVKNSLGEVLATHGLNQLRIAETEKYAHVTFFFNGGRETPFDGEDRELIPSQKVATYDLKPEMSAPMVTEQLIHSVENNDYAVVVCNFANPDMVGHTGNLPATIKAIEVIDNCLGQVVDAVRARGGEILITADHGNAECMVDNKSGQPHTAHTNLLVPLLYIGRKVKNIKEQGTLVDIAPTILYLLGIEKPSEMTGSSLVKIG